MMSKEETVRSTLCLREEQKGVREIIIQSMRRLCTTLDLCFSVTLHYSEEKKKKTCMHFAFCS